MSWSEESDRVYSMMQAQLDRIIDAHTREQTAAWVRAWDDVAPELEATLNELALNATDGRVRRNVLIQSVRLRRALEVIQGRLAGLVDGSAASIIASLDDVVDYAGSMQERLIASQLPRDAAAEVAAWSRVSPNAMDAIVVRSTEQITKLSYPISDEAAAAMRRSLVRGITVGENPVAVARRMVAGTEGLFNGGLGRALTIARTEMLDAHRAAAALEDSKNTDILNGWVWLASISARTCQACWSMHGREFPLTQPGPQGHQNCRCARGPVTKSWADLGFDIDEPPSLLPNRDSSFAALTPVEQRDILGPRGYEAWQSGIYPMDDWAAKRQTPGWRDSWVPSKAPKVA